jgi:hypothetical protein
MLHARRVKSPAPRGSGAVDHEQFQPILATLRTGGIAALADERSEIDRYRNALASTSPDRLTPPEALAFWLNLYNSGAIASATDAHGSGLDSVLRLPGVFSSGNVDVDGELLSLDDIEHGKIRRFGDPRIHASLVCGSVSCPTLRYEPFTGTALDAQLDDQMRTFLARGGASVERSSNQISLSMVFRWYGRDFTRPDRMPTLIPERSHRVRDAIAHWMPDTDRDFVRTHKPPVHFQSYDWGLGCSVA